MEPSRLVLSGKPFASIRWQETLDLAAECGYSAIEGIPDLAEAFRDTTEIGRQELTQRNLRWIGRTHRGDWCNPDKRDSLYAFHMDYAREIHRMGGDTLFIEPGTRDVFTDIRQDFQEIAHLLNELGKHTSDFGVSLTIRTAHNQRIATLDEIDRLMNLLDLEAVSLCPDTAELLLSETEVNDVIHSYAEGIQHIIWSDQVHPDNDEDTRTFCEPGKGHVDFARIAKWMSETSISGWVVVEWRESIGHPKDSAYEVMETMLDVIKRYPEVRDEPGTNRGLALW